jgi:hypothetical protein
MITGVFEFSDRRMLLSGYANRILEQCVFATTCVFLFLQ